MSFLFSMRAFSKLSLTCLSCFFRASVSFVSWAMSDAALRQRAEDHPIKHEIFILFLPKARTRTGRSAQLTAEKNQPRNAFGTGYEYKEGKEETGGPRVSGSEYAMKPD